MIPVHHRIEPRLCVCSNIQRTPSYRLEGWDSEPTSLCPLKAISTDACVGLALQVHTRDTTSSRGL